MPRHAGSKENRMPQGQIVGDVMECLILWRHNGLYHLGIMRFVLNLTHGCLTQRTLDNIQIYNKTYVNISEFGRKVSYELNSIDPV